MAQQYLTYAFEAIAIPSAIWMVWAFAGFALTKWDGKDCPGSQSTPEGSGLDLHPWTASDEEVDDRNIPTSKPCDRHFIAQFNYHLEDWLVWCEIDLAGNAAAIMEAAEAKDPESLHVEVWTHWNTGIMRQPKSSYEGYAAVSYLPEDSEDRWLFQKWLKDLLNDDEWEIVYGIRTMDDIVNQRLPLVARYRQEAIAQ